DEEQAGHLPHCWEVTSDSLAARVAVVAQARQLVLLKSGSIPEAMSWVEAGRGGYGDAYFAGACRQGGAGRVARAVNSRAPASWPVRRARRPTPARGRRYRLRRAGRRHRPPRGPRTSPARRLAAPGSAPPAVTRPGPPRHRPPGTPGTGGKPRARTAS